MADSTAVALLFDDVALGTHLREVLAERGARIVHEGGLADLSRELIQRVAPDVVVINLEGDVDAALDRLDQAVEGDHPRVVFNEAESSRALDGWDRARWARHLAAKVLAQADVDPPRPPAAIEAEPAPDMHSGEPDDQPMATPDEARYGAEAIVHEAETAAESESLEAELEALLAGEPLPEDVDSVSAARHADPDADPDTDTAPDDTVTVLDDFELDELALRELDNGAPATPLYDGNFLEGAALAPAADGGLEDADAGHAPAGGAAAAPADDVLDLAWSEDEAALLASLDAEASAAPAPTPAADAEALFRRTDAWSLVDEDTPASAPPPKPSAADYGIEKLSATEFLAPDSDAADEASEPFMTLELVSLEEAIAPQRGETHGSPEMLLDELGGALSRVVMLGAAASSAASVRQFLAALPRGFRATLIHVQHQAGRPVAELVEELTACSPVPVRLGAHGMTVHAGELVVMPAEHHPRLSRDGRLELRQAQDVPACSPSIDACFTAVANVFGVDALAILFAGQANDAVAGCQAVHDRGGRIWVEDAPGEHVADMVSGVLAEHLADFSGTPAELAARLIEEY